MKTDEKSHSFHSISEVGNKDKLGFETLQMFDHIEQIDPELQRKEIRDWTIEEIR